MVRVDNASLIVKGEMSTAANGHIAPLQNLWLI